MHTHTAHIYRMYTLFPQLHAILSKYKCFYLHFFSSSHIQRKQMEIAESRKQITFMLYVWHFCRIKHRKKCQFNSVTFARNIQHTASSREWKRKRNLQTKFVPLNIHRELNLWLIFFCFCYFFLSVSSYFIIGDMAKAFSVISQMYCYNSCELII